MKAGPEARQAAYARMKAAQDLRHEALLARLQEKVLDDPEGIWSELLAEALGKEI